MPRNEKPFDAVRMIRSIGNAIDEQTRGITFDEEQAYIQECLRPRPSDPTSDTKTARLIPSGAAGEGLGGP